MSTLVFRRLDHCHLCGEYLWPNPLWKAESAYCPEDGDFFVRNDGTVKHPKYRVYFRGWEKDKAVGLYPEVTRGYRPATDEELGNEKSTRNSEIPLWQSLAKGKPRGSVGRRVRCEDTGETFNSVKEAAAKFGIKSWGISAVIHGRRKTVHGHRFVALPDSEDLA